MQAIVDKMRSDFRSDQMLCFAERVDSASKGSPHNNDIFTTFFRHQIDIQEFWGLVYMH